MLLNESPSGAGIVPMHCTIRQVLRRSIRLIANAIPLPMILRRSFRFPNDRFGFIVSVYPISVIRKGKYGTLVVNKLYRDFSNGGHKKNDIVKHCIYVQIISYHI